MSTNYLYFIVLADMTQREVQECVTLGIEGGLSAIHTTDSISGHYKPKNCDNKSEKDEGLHSLFFQVK